MAVAFQLREEAGPGPLTFPGFPGVYEQGQPIEAQVFVDEGIADSVEDLVERMPPQLMEVTVAAGSAPLPERPNHVPNAEQATSAAEKVLAEMSHDELDAKAAELEIEFPKKNLTIGAKAEFLEAAMSSEELEETGAEALTDDDEEPA